jgi:AraC-like DNA-binding protein
MGLSSASLQPSSTLARRLPDGTPVYAYQRLPGLPPIAVTRLAGHAHASDDWPPRGAHAHEFLMLCFFERGGGELAVDGRSWKVESGDVLVVAPGEVIAPVWTGQDTHASAWTVAFPPDAVETRNPGTLGSWRAHPLLFPFIGHRAGGAQRLHVPEAERTTWRQRFAELERELTERRDGCAEAALAELTLILVGLARLASDVPGHLRLRDEPVLAAVFDEIERRFAEPISLRDVADAVGMSAGHLTTLVGRRTGRTVQQWITERRMSEARRLLADTDLTVQTVANRVGYRDAGYLIRRFRAAHGVPPREWRHAGRPA